MAGWGGRSSSSKFGNLTSLCQMGHSHRSKLESAVCAMIGLRQRAGEIELIQVEAHVHLTAARIAYVADFKCMDLKTGQLIYIEAKGLALPVFNIKKRLWKHYGPARLEIWGGTHTRPRLIETIDPVVSPPEALVPPFLIEPGNGD